MAVVLAMLLVAGTASAEILAPQDPAQAVAAQLDEVVVKEGYRTAEALRHEGDLQGARAVLRLTYERVRTPYLLWPMAELDRDLRHPLPGLRALREYTDRVPAEEQKGHDPDRLRRELRAQVARLRISTDEPGALLIIDGEQRGAAPLADPVEVDPGRHHVEARGKHTVERDVVAWPGTDAAVNLRLAGSRWRSPSVLARWFLLGTGTAAMIVGASLWADPGCNSGAMGTCTPGPSRTAGIVTFAAGAGLFTASVITLIFDERRSASLRATDGPIARQATR